MILSQTTGSGSQHYGSKKECATPGTDVKTTGRRQNRETFIGLFRGFVDDYGDIAGKKIVKHLVDVVAEAECRRIWIPDPGPDPLSRCGRTFRKLWRTTCEVFGRSSGRAVMNKIMIELGGKRVNFPDHQTLCRWERNAMIYQQHKNGMTMFEITSRWNLSDDQVVIILAEELVREERHRDT